MRFTSTILGCALFVSASAGTLWVRQSAQPPPCSLPCLDTSTNNVSLGDCSATDAACQCRSAPYVQGVINCLATVCASHDDVESAIQFSTGYCGLAGVNSAAPGLTTPLSQLPPSTAASGTGTAAPSSGGVSTTSPAASTTSHSGAFGAMEPRLILGAVLLAAVGVVAGL